jgi:flagellar basal body P-ring protein FlgI
MIKNNDKRGREMKKKSTIQLSMSDENKKKARKIVDYLNKKRNKKNKKVSITSLVEEFIRQKFDSLFRNKEE